ncbi:hypothetical protein EVAR_49788_1 [Eumeta japonica]|uniref:Uncharacterized protein n=1 Tax=Eumeta variegata TaxID=151549 RepID=A0A4C1Y0A8_EUMVA|nr:hypothetical protein EVAR_49788_1 [Eumeta japonica]
MHGTPDRYNESATGIDVWHYVQYLNTDFNLTPRLVGTRQRVAIVIRVRRADDDWERKIFEYQPLTRHHYWDGLPRGGWVTGEIKRAVAVAGPASVVVPKCGLH